jgi:CubicO group peptidase (beta-lactamase class C family)
MIRASKALLTLATLTLALACNDDGNLPAFATGQGDAGRPNDAATKLDFSRFDDALEAAIAKYNAGAADTAQILGASAVVVHEKLGTVHTHGYGAYDADRLYLIASSSKILSVGVLMRLADQGKLDIDQPIGTYLKDWGDSDSKAMDITAAQLLSNSSGLPSLSEVSAAASDTTSPYYSNLCQYTEAGTLQDCGKVLYATDPPRKPDTMFAYGGSQWQLAGALAEHVSGSSWADLIADAYVKPCGVPSLGYTNQFGKAGTGYPAFFMGDAANLPVTDNPSIEGGAYVSAPDYGKLLLMHLRGGKCDDTRVLSEDAVLRMQRNRIGDYGGTTGDANEPGYGLGFWVNEQTKVIVDPGAYGAYPVLDLARRYGALIAIEVTSDVGVQLGLATKPSLDAIFDDAKL